VIFKILGVLFFYMGNLFFGSAFSFILIVLCSAFDFWVVKNVTGRKLVGLRWWVEHDPKGKEKYVFESMPNE
jgi:hypothetical protein